MYLCTTVTVQVYQAIRKRKEKFYQGSPVRFVLLSRVNTSFSSYFKVCTTVYTPPEEKRLVTLSQGCHLVFLVFIQTFYASQTFKQWIAPPIGLPA